MVFTEHPLTQVSKLNPALCAACADAGAVPESGGWAAAVKRVIRHCEHLGIDADQMAAHHRTPPPTKARQVRCEMSPVSAAQHVALGVAADAALEGREVDEHQLEALLEAAPHTQTAAHRLESLVATRGWCAGYDTEAWYPPYAEDGDVDDAVLAAERAQAAELCAGCPVRGECLALALRIGSHGCHGVWGGLAPRGRDALRPMWAQLRARLAEAAQADRNVVEDLVDEHGWSVAS